jgi:hypothetical protein
MITVDEARELVNTAEIPFPQDWKEQILCSIEDNIKTTAANGRKVLNVKGVVIGRPPGRYGTFNLSAGQFAEISAVLKQCGFGVGEDFRIRFDGQPLAIDIIW